MTVKSHNSEKLFVIP